MAAKRKPHVKLQCTACKRIAYYTYKSKKLDLKINLKKHCKFCKKHTPHKEIKR